MQPRRKPRINHVRTGCLTCKRRRVKCPEEHPQCSRCIRGGFVCAGYAVPKPWIFESSAGVQKQFEEEESEPVTPTSHLESGIHAPPASQLTHALNDTSLSSPLQLGNSDPFNCYAIPIGPYEAYLLRVYDQLVIPQLECIQPPEWKGFITNELCGNSHRCLQDEASAYSLFARNAALEHAVIRRSYTTMSTPLLNYMAKTQAALHKRLTLMDGSETPSTACTIMWTTCYLASAEMIMRSPTTDFHFQALGKLIVRYFELNGKDGDIGTILIPVYIVLMRAMTTFTRSVLDMVDWFPRVCQDTWSTAESVWSTQDNSSSENAVHGDIKDEMIRDVMTNQRLGPHFSYDLIKTCQGPEQTKLLSHAARSQELHRNGRMLDVATDAMSKLESADLTVAGMQDESARAYVAISTIVWLRLTSTTTFLGNAIFDASLFIIPHLRALFMGLDERGNRHEQQRYQESQLWALFMAVQSELHRQYVIGREPVCGEWFMDRFFDHVSAMRIQSWQQAVNIFEQFLFTDDLEPHISQWWQEVIRDRM